MANKPTGKLYIPIVIFFIIFNSFLITCKSWLAKWGIDYAMVMTGNMVLFIATFLSLLLYNRALTHPSTMGFLRNTYSGLLVKLSVCLIALVVYALIERSNVNKPGIFVCIFLYIGYSVIEMRSLMRYNKERKNA